MTSMTVPRRPRSSSNPQSSKRKPPRNNVGPVLTDQSLWTNHMSVSLYPGLWLVQSDHMTCILAYDCSSLTTLDQSYVSIWSLFGRMSHFPFCVLSFIKDPWEVRTNQGRGLMSLTSSFMDLGASTESFLRKPHRSGKSRYLKKSEKIKKKRQLFVSHTLLYRESSIFFLKKLWKGKP